MVNIHSIFREFEELIGKLLEANGAVVDTPESRGRDRGFDFVATIDGERWAVEVKYYKTSKAQLSLLESAASKLISSFGYQQVTKGMLIVSCFIEPAVGSILQEQYGIVFVDRADLFVWARRVPNLLDRITSILESEEVTPPRFVGRALGDILEGPRRAVVTHRIPDLMGANLCTELRSLNRGRDDWAAYEKLCARILRYLFQNDLQGWHTQLRTDDGFNRYDFVCRIRPTTEFWKFLLHHLDSRYILFEFKNYTKKIRQGQVLTTEKYLLEKGLRRVAIIMTRLGCDEGAIAMTQGAMREHGKLILVIGDDQVCEMLHMKQAGDDPSDLLFATADEFLLTLPR